MLEHVEVGATPTQSGADAWVGIGSGPGAAKPVSPPSAHHGPKPDSSRSLFFLLPEPLGDASKRTIGTGLNQVLSIGNHW